MALSSVLIALTAVAGAADPNVASLTLDAALVCATAGPVYSVSIGGAALLTNSLPLALFENGSWQRLWSRTGSRNVSGTDALGAFSGVECSYAAASAPSVPRFVVAIYRYNTAPSKLRFAYSLPGGAGATNHTPKADAWASTISNFPGFASNHTCEIGQLA